MIEVRAIAKGYAPLDPNAIVTTKDLQGRSHQYPKPVFIEPGTVFRIASEKQFSKEWMERLTPPEPVVLAAPAEAAAPVGTAVMDAEGKPVTRKARK